MWTIVKAMSGSVAVAIVLTGIASAHHSMTQFEGAKEVTIEGVVTEIKWVNPHSSVFVDAVTIDGQAVKGQNWGVEMGTPRALVAKGWTKGLVKIGDKVTLTGLARKDGAPLILLRDVVLPDGNRVTFRGAAD